MAKRKTRKASSQKMSFKQVIVLLGILFSVLLFMIKTLTGRTGWFEIFTPVLIAFAIVFVLSGIQIVLKKMV